MEMWKCHRIKCLRFVETLSPDYDVPLKFIHCIVHEYFPTFFTFSYNRTSPKGLDTPQRSRSWRGSPQRSLRGSSELGSLRYLRGSWSSRTSLRTGSLHDRTEVVFGHCGYHMGKVQKALANILAYRVRI